MSEILKISTSNSSSTIKKCFLIRGLSETATRYLVLALRQNLNRYPVLIIILLDFARACGPKDSEKSNLRIESSF